MAGLVYRLGAALRETGQALDRLGCVLQDNPAFREQLWRHRSLISFVPKVGANSAPKVGSNAFVAPDATVAGDVTLGNNTSVWYGAVIRGDCGKVTVGSGSNIQDHAVITTGAATLDGAAADTTIGANVTIGHNAMLNGATIEDGALVGIGAVVQAGAVVQKGAIVAAGAVVPPGATVPSGQLWTGNPAAFKRELKPEEAKYAAGLAGHYVELAGEHAKANSKSALERAEELVAALKAQQPQAAAA